VLNVLDQTADAAESTLQEASARWLLVKDTAEGCAYKDKAKMMPKADVASMTTVQLSQFVNYHLKKLSKVVSVVKMI
jgi:hypothetical protein